MVGSCDNFYHNSYANIEKPKCGCPFWDRCRGVELGVNEDSKDVEGCQCLE